MSNTREALSMGHVMRYLRGKLLLSDRIRRHLPPNRPYVEPVASDIVAALKKLRGHVCTFSELDGEMDIPPRGAAAFPLANRLSATGRSSHHGSFPWCNALWCGFYGVAGGTVALLAWYPGRWLSVLILLPVIWSTTCSRWSAMSLWAGYYLTGARDIPLVCARFFAGYSELTASTAFALGLVFWMGQAFALAAPWAFLTPRAAEAPRAGRTVIAIILVSLPPLGIIGWLSPVHVSSALYPGWQLAGLSLGVCMLATAGCIWHSRAALWVGALLIGAASVAHLVGHRTEAPFGWVAVDTSLGRLDQGNYEALYARFAATKQAAQRRFEAGAKVIVLPEELAGVWRPAMRYWWQDYLQQLAASRSTLIFGADLPVSHPSFAAQKDRGPFFRYTDSAVVVGYGRGRFDSRQPVPAGLWRPWAGVSASRGSMMQPYLKIAGRRAAFSICYEDFLWWPHWRLLIDRPDVLISMSNEWFDFDLALVRIQQQSADSIARLGDVSLLRAVNR
jgi:hypothetical protein